MEFLLPNKLKPIKTIKALAKAKLIPEEKISKLETVAKQFSVSITPHIAALLHDNNEGLHQQFVPDEQELNIKNHELADPVGDYIKSPVTGIVHRYPDRCLLKVSTVCPVYCRFCFRREEIGHQGKVLTAHELEAAYQYIQSNPEIWEVILTGGDPLMLPPKKLEAILKRLDAIPNVEVIRIHTRIPVVDPKRIKESMLKAFDVKKALFIILHANHANEFTKEASEVIHKIIKHGIPMLSQTVLLKNVNDDVDTLKTLLKTFVKHRIKPFYLHHCDLAKGTSHFRTTLEEGKQLMKALRGNISGLCQPTYVLDIPGGHGKVPVTSDYVQQETQGKYCIEDYQGKKHHYTSE